MILVDFSQVTISSLLKYNKLNNGKKIEEGMGKHMILNSLRSYLSKFGKKYGKMVICVDDRNYWRKDVSPAYKGKRKKNRDESDVDWTTVFEIISQVEQDLREYFPYPVVKVDRAEADDIIGVLSLANCKNEKVLIISGDKDFQQLQACPNVEQWAPVKGEFYVCHDPVSYTLEHIVRGDVGDGVPNVLSPADIFMIEGGRQKRLTQSFIDKNKLLDPNTDFGSVLDENVYARYIQNKKLIDLTQIPENIKQAILDEYSSQKSKDAGDIYKYLSQNCLVNLLESIQDFRIGQETKRLNPFEARAAKGKSKPVGQNDEKTNLRSFFGNK